ncbi:hypothetical protein [Clostridium sp.]|uniref:hypothetical protein n=1 Tax=Clostridium sp. TaxID=1506 RepID=UPI0025C1E630|nr:hypothetical protein [Clostridium sp.]MCI9069745.1 hypothetical protein [Clostridium sp.]
MNRKNILLANKIAFEFILGLSEIELKELLEKSSKLKLVKCKDIITSDNTKSENEIISDLIKELYSISSKEEAIKYLNKFKVTELKKIAKESNVFIKSKNKKIEIIDRIVEGTIGSKIKMDMLKS